MIGKKLVTSMLFVMTCSLPLFVFTKPNKPNRPSLSDNEKYALIANMYYQSAKVMIGSYLAIGGIFNTFGSPWNFPLLSLYEVDRRIPCSISIVSALIAYHGMNQLLVILEKKRFKRIKNPFKCIFLTS